MDPKIWGPLQSNNATLFKIESTKSYTSNFPRRFLRRIQISSFKPTTLVQLYLLLLYCTLLLIRMVFRTCNLQLFALFHCKVPSFQNLNQTTIKHCQLDLSSSFSLSLLLFYGTSLHSSFLSLFFLTWHPLAGVSFKPSCRGTLSEIPVRKFWFSAALFIQKDG